MLGLRCCMQAFSSCGELGPPVAAVRGLLTVAASLCCRARTLGARAFSSCSTWALERRVSSCGARAQLPRGTWDLPRPGLEPVSPALAGRFLTTAPPGKPKSCISKGFLTSLWQCFNFVFNSIIIQKIKHFLDHIDNYLITNCQFHCPHLPLHCDCVSKN